MIQSKDLKKLVGYKVGKFRGEELTDKDIQSVRDLVISGKKLNGTESDIRIAELKHFPNLELISISQFVLDNTSLDVLKQISSLRSISFNQCEIKEDSETVFDKTTSLTYKNCRISDYSTIGLAENTTFIGEPKIKLGALKNKEKVKKLSLQECSLDSLEELFGYEKLELLQLLGTELEDTKGKEELKNKICVIENDKTRPIR